MVSNHSSEISLTLASHTIHLMNLIRPRNIYHSPLYKQHHYSYNYLQIKTHTIKLETNPWHLFYKRYKLSWVYVQKAEYRTNTITSTNIYIIMVFSYIIITMPIQTLAVQLVTENQTSKRSTVDHRCPCNLLMSFLSDHFALTDQDHL